MEASKQADIDCLARLMTMVGQQLEANPEAKGYMDVYFPAVAMLSQNMSIESRIRSSLQASLQL